jgi:zinc transporter 1
MRGVFLHVLGDALGSVIVIISALVIWLCEGDWRFYVDPAMRFCSFLILILVQAIQGFTKCYSRFHMEGVFIFT